jgi:ABC-type Fe3+/spermidine/putrescine transport system ATPase subunit
LLLDEPLSNLDPSLREDLRDQIRSIIRELEVTTVFVTHDQQEAFSLADRVAIMDAGICRQVGKPAEVYNRPADMFVAGFLGKANFLPGTFVGLDDDAMVMVRPENVFIGKQGGRTLEVLVAQAVMEGAIVQYTLDYNGTRIIARAFHHGAPIYKPGDSVSISVAADRYHILEKP